MQKVLIGLPAKCTLLQKTPCTLVGAEDLKIMEVRPEQEAAFLKEYAGRILVAGSSIQDVIMKFSASLKS
jgi:hypothetical protein